MADVFVAVPFVKQQTLYYCGPATLQMMLSMLGVASPATPPSWQDTLWAAVQANTGATRPSSAPSTPTAPAFATQKCEWCTSIGWRCWSTTPGVLEYLANARQTVAKYSISTHGTEESATGVLLDTIDANLPAVALVRGWQHWLAVDGYRHGEPGATVVAGRNLNGVFIRDPWESAAIHYIAWDDWESDYLSFVPCGDYKSSMVVMGGVRVPPRERPTAPPNTPTNLRIDPLGPPRLRLRLVKRIVPATTAIAAAMNDAANLGRTGRLRAGFDAAEATNALLVQRLDDHDRYYYIVTFQSGGRETARVIVDAHDAHVSEVSAIARKGQSLPQYATARMGRERLLAASKSLSPALRYRLRAETIGEHPVPVWKPCGQSSSPFLPFWQYSVGDSFVYYRFDGLPFDDLTEGPA